MKLFKFKRKPRESDVDKKDRYLHIKLTKERNKAKKVADSIDLEIFAVQKSTRTLVPFMAKPHNYLRMRFRWYYNWHLKPYARNVHWGVVAFTLIISMGSSFISVYGFPNWGQASIDFAPQITEKNIDYHEIYSSVPEGSTELTEKRTYNQKVFKRPDGQEQYIIFGGPVHYEDANGKWNDIDSSLSVKNDGTGFSMDKSIYTADFNKQFTANPLLSVARGDMNLTMKPGELSLTNGTDNQPIDPPNTAEATADSHQVLYKDAYGPGLDFAYETQDLQLNKKLNITSFESLPTPTIDLSDNDASSIKLNLQYGLSAGLELFIDNELWDGSQKTIENQNIVFKKGEEIVWQLTPALAWDSSPVNASEGKQSNTVIGKSIILITNNKLDMSILFPYSWLKNAEYPVTIDPTTYYGKSTCASILSVYNQGWAVARTTTRGTSASYPTLGYQGNGGGYEELNRAYLEFDTSGIGSAAIVNAQLYMSIFTKWGGTTSWDARIHKYNWTSPLAAPTLEADYDGALASTYDTVWVNGANVEVRTSYGSQNLDTTWIQKTGTTQYAILADFDVNNIPKTTTIMFSLNGASVATPGLRPYLSITSYAVGRYWVASGAGTHNWNDTANWSDASNGSGGSSVPGVGEAAIFDGAGGTTGDLTIDTTVSVAYLVFDNNYSGAITQGSNTITTADGMDLLGTNLTAGANITASGKLSISASRALDMAGYNLTITSTFTNNGTLKLQGGETLSLTNDTTNGTVEYNGTGGPYTIPNLTYYNLKINSSGKTFKLPATTTVNKNVTITAGTLDSNSYDMTVKGNWANSGTFTAGNRTVTFDSKAIGNTIDCGSSAFSTIKMIDSTGYGTGVWSPLNNTLQAAVLDVYDGIFNNSNGNADVTVTMELLGSYGTINMTTNTVNLSVSKTASISIGYDSWTFNNLTFSKTSGTPTINTSAGYSGEFIITNTLTIASGVTLNAGSGIWNLTGAIATPFSYSGTLTPATSTFVYKNVNAGGDVNVTTAPYKNLTFTPASAETYNLQSNLTGGNAIGGNLSLSSTNATFDPKTYDLTVTGNYSSTSGKFGIVGTKPSGVHVITGTFTNSGTFYLSSSATATIITGNVTCTGTLNATSNGSLTLNGSTVYFTSGTFTKGSGTLLFNKGAAQTFRPGTSNNFGAVRISTASTNVTVTTANPLVTTLTIDASTTLNITNMTITITGTGTGGSRPYQKSGTFTSTGSTVVYTGSGSTTDIETANYNILTLTPTSGTTYNQIGNLTTPNNIASTFTISNSNATFDPQAYNLTVTGAFTNTSGNFGITGTKPSGIHVFSSTWTNSGTFFLSSNATATVITGNVTCTGTLNATSNGSLTVNGTTVYFTSGTFTKGSGTLLFNKGAAQTFRPTTSASDFGAVRTSTASTNVTVDTANPTLASLTIDGSTTFNITNMTMTISGTGTPLSISGTFTTTSSTVIYNGGSATDIAQTVYNNLQVTGAATYTLLGHLSTTNALTGAITIGNGATLSTSASNYDITLAGNWANSGSLTQGTGTVTLNGAGAQSFTAGGTGAGKTPYNLTITNTSASGVTFADSLTLAASGTFTAATPSTKLTFTDGASYNFPLININGSGAGDITMTKGAGAHGHFHFIVPGTPTVTYVTVDNSDATGSGAEIDATSNCHDGTGNTYWVFVVGIPPVNDSLTFTNPYSGTAKTAVADDTTSWAFRALVTDDNGGSDINYVTLGFANGADSTTPFASIQLKWDRATDTFSEEADTQSSVTLTSSNSDSNLSGNQWTLDFKLKLNDQFTTLDTDYAIELYSLDSTAMSDFDSYSNIYRVTGMSLSLNVDSGTVAFGGLLPGSIVTATTVTTVTTNYPNGYSLSIEDGIAGTNSSLLHTDLATLIADFTGTITTPILYLTGSGLGICVFSATSKDAKWGTGTTETDLANKYTGIPETATIITSKTGVPTASNQTSIGYKLIVPNNQKTGNYAGQVDYTATGVLE